MAMNPMNELYETVNAMMARLGADGIISADAPVVDAVMNALHDMDGGSPPILFKCTECDNEENPCVLWGEPGTPRIGCPWYFDYIPKWRKAGTAEPRKGRE